MAHDRVYADEGLGTVSGVVTSLPVGYTLGEKRIKDEITYRLCYNASSDSPAYPGHVLSAIPAQLVTADAGSYSMTVTTTSGTGNNVAAAVCHHATAATGAYFWGVTRGRLASGLVCNAALSASTGGFVAIDTTAGVGKITTMSLANAPIAQTFKSMTTGSTSPARTGDVFVFIE